MYKKVLIYKDNIKEMNPVNEYKTLKPTMTFNRSIFCPNPIMIQDPQDAIIKEIKKNRTSKDCRINLKAGKNIHIHLRLIKLPSPIKMDVTGSLSNFGHFGHSNYFPYIGTR